MAYLILGEESDHMAHIHPIVHYHAAWVVYRSQPGAGLFEACSVGGLLPIPHPPLMLG